MRDGGRINPSKAVWWAKTMRRFRGLKEQDTDPAGETVSAKIEGHVQHLQEG